MGVFLNIFTQVGKTKDATHLKYAKALGGLCLNLRATLESRMRGWTSEMPVVNIHGVNRKPINGTALKPRKKDVWDYYRKKRSYNEKDETMKWTIETGGQVIAEKEQTAEDWINLWDAESQKLENT